MQVLTRLLPLFMSLLVIVGGYNLRVYNGLTDPQSMDNAQLARQIARGAGYTTKFIRPYALGQLNSRLQPGAGGKPTTLFPDAQYPKGMQRIIPDTYNAPGYPYLLAGWFRALVPDFQQTAAEMGGSRYYVADRPIPALNQIFVIFTGGLMFILGLRLFDERVAWTGMIGFYLTNLVWQYSVTALPACALMFFFTIILIAASELYLKGELRARGESIPFWPGWLWALLISIVLGLACLARLDLVVLVLPLAIFLGLVPEGSKLVIPLLLLVVAGMTVPWFWQMYKITGCLIGSNLPLLHYGAEGHEGNQVYCTLAAPNYNQLFKDIAGKQVLGFSWSFSHMWELLGANPLVLLFFASILHHFKRGRAQAIRWLLVGCGLAIILATSCGSPKPAAVDPWNGLVVLLPGILVVGSAFLFILIDRLSIELWTINTAIVVAVLILASSAMISVLLDPRGNRMYPPYVPAALRQMGGYVHQEEWISTDIPWAEAWYGDHAAVWIPDSMADFNDIFDNYNNSGLLLITPLFLSMPVTTFTSGEYKDWLPFVSNSGIPSNFQLNVQAPTNGSLIEYYIWVRPHGL